jgi:hypothetical protein
MQWWAGLKSIVAIIVLIHSVWIFWLEVNDVKILRGDHKIPSHYFCGINDCYRYNSRHASVL